MDNEIQFGEVEHAAPQIELRPDQNLHFAVVPYDSPETADLPIYVDLDVLRDMEAHAQTDKSVELGGVMLGGQFEDDDGNAFVIVTDSLRAKHYESTKGSFKFTHDTWSEITRQRGEFPDELQMVGWYHTHPDWGVFLSGMDMFICDNFFNRELDIALVIDPCRLDRGMFHWTGREEERIRRTGGFYLMASRFREAELYAYSDQLKGKFTMAQPSGYPAPIVNVHESHTPQWQAQAILGMMGIQFLFIALIAWRMIFPGMAATTAKKKLDEVSEVVAAMRNRDEAIATVRAQQNVLNETLKTLGKGQSIDYKKLIEFQKKIDSLHASNLGHAAQTANLARELIKTKKELTTSQDLVTKQDKKITKLAKDRRAYVKLKKLNKKDGKTKDGEETKKTNWVVYGGLIALGVAAVLAVGMMYLSRREEELRHPKQPEFEDAPEDNPPQERGSPE